MARTTRSSRTYLRAHATARLAGNDLDPSDVSRRLELPPDVAIRKGDPRITRARSGKVQVYSPYSTGVWGMSSENWVDSWRMATHLDWLIGQLEPKSAEIAELLGRGFVGDLYCYSMGRTTRLPPIPRQLRTRARKLGFAINIDHYDCSDDGE